jgi:outer membrane immunogenic protein
MRGAALACTSALLFGFAVSTASAADLPVRMPVKAPPPAVVAVYNWTGFYIGGNVGGAWLRKSVTELGPGEVASTVGVTNKLTAAGVTAGGQAGYNWHANNWLVGVEADFNWTRINKTIITFDPANPFDIDDILRGKVDWFATFRGRLGYVANNWLFYATGGGAVAKLINEYGDTVNGALAPPDSVSLDKVRWGWTVGGGVELGLGGNWSAKAEYLYIDFRKFNATPINGVGVVRFHDELHVARIGLNYRFGGPVVARY